MSVKLYGILPKETRENSLTVLLFVLMLTSQNIEKHCRTFFFERAQIT